MGNVIYIIFIIVALAIYLMFTITKEFNAPLSLKEKMDKVYLNQIDLIDKALQKSTSSFYVKKLKGDYRRAILHLPERSSERKINKAAKLLGKSKLEEMNLEIENKVQEAVYEWLSENVNPTSVTTIIHTNKSNQYFIEVGETEYQRSEFANIKKEAESWYTDKTGKVFY